MLGKAYPIHYSPITSIFPRPFSFTWVSFMHLNLPMCSSFTWESFSSLFHAQKFVLVLFSEWIRKIYVFLCFHGFFNWWEPFFYLAEWPRRYILIFGVHNIRFGSLIAIVAFRNQKYNLGLGRGRFWLYCVIKRLLISYFYPWCFFSTFFEDKNRFWLLGPFTHLPFLILASRMFLSMFNTVIIVYWIRFWPC